MSTPEQEPTWATADDDVVIFLMDHFPKEVSDYAGRNPYELVIHLLEELRIRRSLTGEVTG